MTRAAHVHAIEPLERLLPRDLAAERAVLGAIIVHNAAYDIVADIVSSDHFYRDAHRRVFLSAAHLMEHNRACDLVTLKDELARRGDLDEVGGPAFISSLTDGVPKSTNAKHYAGIVHEKAERRYLIATAGKMLTMAYEGEEEVPEIVSVVDKAILDMRAGRAGNEMASLATHSSAFFKSVEQAVANGGKLLGLDTGLPALNDLTLGWQQSDLIILAAKSSGGKSTLALNQAVCVARTGTVVAFFSPEMKRKQLQFRLAGQLSGIDTSRIMAGQIANGEHAKLSMAIEEMHTLPIHINDQGGLKVADIRHGARRLQAEKGLGLVVVDYVQRMRGSLERKGATRYDELSDISTRLKDLAGELDVPVIVLSQVNRKSEGRPQLGDLRDCGRLEEDADNVMFLHPARDSFVELIVAKQRNGSTGSVWLKMDKYINKFSDGGDGPVKPAASSETPRPRAAKRHRRFGPADGIE